jgi:hypothetical protein
MERKLALLTACAFLFACGPGGIEDSGAADVTLESADEVLELVHDPALSQITLTPPTGGEVEMQFSYQDPLVDVLVRANADQVAAGDVVDLPSDPNRLEVSVAWGEGIYRSQEGSTGTVDVQSFETDEEAGYAFLSVVIAADLADAATGETLAVNGFVEGSVGSLDDGAAE